ncbi:GNAT family N-acetyltransferase [Azospirillum thiophilum]|uniref:GNAT family N-acetyltransferase n=1 Tax=Azospirillum thiophilum TaxID=528244 RepID=UPI0013147BDA
METCYLPTAELLVAVDGRDVPHGFLGASGGHIDTLFVHAGSSGGGLGRRLVDHVRQGRDEVTVDVNERNEAGRGFYECLRFAVYGRSETDGDGRPYPLLRLRWRRADPAGAVPFGPRAGFSPAGRHLPRQDDRRGVGRPQQR